MTDSLLRSLNRKRLDGRKGFLQELAFPHHDDPEYTKERLFIGWEVPTEWVEWEEFKGNWESTKKVVPFFIDVSQSITSLTLGPRGCLVGDTLVRCYDGKILQKVPISQLVGKEVFVSAFNFKKMKTEKNRAVFFSCGKKEVFEIELETGEKIQATKDHRFFVKTDKKIIEKRLEDLQEGEKILFVKDGLPKKGVLSTFFGRKLSSPLLDIKGKIKKIRKIGIRETFDGNVQKNHNYFANNILVHNSGKTFLLRGMLSRLAKAGYAVAHISDIKNEMSSNNKPAYSKYKHLLDAARFEKPETIPTTVLLPKFLEKTYDEYPKGNQRFQLSFRDITESDLISIFGFEDERDKIQLIKKMYSEIKELKITNFEEMVEFVEESRDLHTNAKKTLYLTIENLEREEVFGDEYAQDIVEILQKGNVLSLNLKGYKEFAFGYSQSYVAFIINKLRRERRSKTLKNPLYLFADEAHAFCPNKGNPPSKPEIKSVISEDRMYGISLIMASQYPEQLPKDDILKQITHFFLPYNIDPDTRKFVLDLVGATKRDDQYTDKWRKFFAKLKKYEWCYINRENRIPRRIRPASPLCRHEEESGF